ncbi:hypothetical protein C0Q60_03495 [Streptomyces albidoflavus]|nr:hypothetical protein C0Q60_03495 [Streptomyces albidoflavus]RZE04948.1 hypothetical protein C0Q62_03410 [Streptomyces albidoflavus]
MHRDTAGVGETDMVLGPHGAEDLHQVVLVELESQDSRVLVLQAEFFGEGGDVDVPARVLLLAVVQPQQQAG